MIWRFLVLAFLTGLGALPVGGPAAAKEPLRLVFATELEPLSFMRDGRPRGLFLDIAHEIVAHRLGLPMTAALFPWERAQQMVRQGEADGFITIATRARAEYANCGRVPVLRAPLHPLVRADHPRRQEMAQARSLEALKPFAVVSYLGNGWAKQNLAGHDVYYAADFLAALKGLAMGRGDLGFVTTTAGAYALREHELDGKLAMLPLVVDMFEYVLCLGKQSPHAGLLPEFERVAEVMRAEGAYGPILRKYGIDPLASY
jgi:polar amino acid transport system substrate-binding protein